MKSNNGTRQHVEFHRGVVDRFFFSCVVAVVAEQGTMGASPK